MQQTEAGEVWWGAQVTVYVDGVKVGVTTGGEATPHLLISRLCEGETSESDGAASALLGWRQALPPLPPGRHLVRRTSAADALRLAVLDDSLACHRFKWAKSGASPPVRTA